MRKRPFLSRAWGGLTRHQDWNIGIVRAPISAFVDPVFEPEVQWLPPPPAGRFAADPFVFVHSGAHYLLYEDYTFATERGHLAAIRLGEDGSGAACGPVLKAPTHLAYPFVFEWNGETYCVPESADGGEVALYRIERIPGTLQKTGTLLSGIAAIDPTVFRYGNRWWLAFTDRAHGSNEALFLYFAGSPLGPWTPHLMNPVKRDIRSARPAGTPFLHEDTLYRPAQDCSATYGGRIALNRVTELTPERFSEETVRWIEPRADGPRPHGLHTISSAGDITVIDGKRERFVPSAAFGLFRRQLGALFSASAPRKRPDAVAGASPVRPGAES